MVSCIDRGPRSSRAPNGLNAAAGASRRWSRRG